MKTEPNQSAYPLDHKNYDHGHGLSKREHFAAVAMQGILCQLRSDIVTAKMQAEYYATEYPSKTMFEAVALESVSQADALIKALNENQ